MPIRYQWQPNPLHEADWGMDARLNLDLTRVTYQQIVEQLGVEKEKLRAILHK